MRRPTRTWALGSRAIKVQISRPPRGRAALARNNRAPIKMSEKITRPASPARRRRKTATRTRAHRSRTSEQNSSAYLLETNSAPPRRGLFLLVSPALKLWFARAEEEEIARAAKFRACGPWRIAL